MAARIVIDTEQHKTAGPYAGVTGVHPNASIYVISGQAPVNTRGDVPTDDFAAQARLTLDNCLTQLDHAGCTFADVFKATIYLTNLDNWAAFNEIYKEYFVEPYPARTAVRVGLLPGFQVEIEMWAARE